MAGEMLGLKLIFMTEEGAANPISEKMIESCRNNVELPIIIGGELTC